MRLRDQGGQGMIFRQVDLPEVLAHLGRDIVEVQLGVNLFFGFAGDRRSTLKRAKLYSFNVYPIFRARWRRATLCAFDPVKYCMAAPNDSGGRRRTSTCMPLRR